MQDIDKFGFNLVNLAEKENYPWSSPEAAIESELQMSPEEFIQNSLELFSEFEAGTEGVIGDAWTWFTNLIRRFWNWITGNNKKEKAKIEKVEEKIKTLNKEYKNPPIQEDTTKSYKEAMIKNKKEFNKAMTDPSTRLEIGDNGVTAKHVYWAPVGEDDLGVIDSLVNVSFSVTLLHKKINDLLYALDRSKSWDDFLQLSNNEAVKQFVLILNESTKDIDNVYSNLKIKSYDNIKDAAAVNNIYYSKLKYIKKASLDLENIIGRLNNSIKNIKLDPNSNNSMAKPTSTVFTKFITKDYPNYKKSIDNFVTKLDNLYSDAIKRNRISAKANGLGNESEEFNFDVEFDSFEQFDNYKKNHRNHSSYINANGLESVFGFVATPSITSEYVYDGLEEEYFDIKRDLSNVDASINEYFDEDTYFGLESDDNMKEVGFIRRIPMYILRGLSAIKRFFIWILSKFSNKFKEKYELDKIRAEFNKELTKYGKYVPGFMMGHVRKSFTDGLGQTFTKVFTTGAKTDHEKKVAIDKLITASVKGDSDKFNKEIADRFIAFAKSGDESEYTSYNIFDITSGLESEGNNITVTDYKIMNDSIINILENSKDLAKFHKYFIDMVTTGKATSSEFNKLITKDLQELPNKLKTIKFPGQTQLTPEDVKDFKKEVNVSLDYCKEFKSIIDYMEKHKAKIDKFFDNPELKDNTLAKDMIAAMNRYYVPSMKSISDIIEWYVRCINTDIKKIKNVTK